MARPSRIPQPRSNAPSKASKTAIATSPTIDKTAEQYGRFSLSPSKAKAAPVAKDASRIPITAADRECTATMTSRPPPSIYRGDAQALFDLNRFVKRDIQGYVSDKYPGFDKVGHELIKPTGKKFVYHLSLTAKDTAATPVTPDMMEAMAAFVEEVEQPDVPEIMVTCPSTAGSVSDYDEDFEDSVEDDNIEIILTTEADERLDEHSSHNRSGTITSPPTSSQILSISPDAARKGRLMRSHQGTSLASFIARADAPNQALTSEFTADLEKETTHEEFTAPDKISETNTREPTQVHDTTIKADNKPRLLRSQKATSLAALIAKAAATVETYPDADSDSDSDSSSTHSGDSDCAYARVYDPVNYKFMRGPCYDPDFPGHSPCATHLPGGKGKSPEAAITVTQDRFMDRHYKTTPMRRYKDWCTVKYEFDQEMVHGPSDLRLTKSIDDNEEEAQAGVEWEDEAILPSSSLPRIEIDDKSSSFEVDVDDSVGKEPEASGFLEVEDAENKSHEGRTQLDAENVQVSACRRNQVEHAANYNPQRSSSPFDETVAVYVEPPTAPDVADDVDSMRSEVSIHFISVRYTMLTLYRLPMTLLSPT